MVSVQDLEILYPDRKEIKKQITELETQIEMVTQELDLEKAKLYSSHSFMAKASDQKGRAHEFTLVCSSNKTITDLQLKLKTLKLDLKGLENTLSEINYEQRERVIDSMLTASGVFRAFSEAVKGFQDAVDKLVESRKK